MSWLPLLSSGSGSSWRQVLPLGLAGLFVWGLWVFRILQSRKYTPVINDYKTTVSLVVPSFREDPDILVQCAQTWSVQQPDEIIVVIDVDDNDAAQALLDLGDPLIQVVRFKHSGKRSALGEGVRLATCELVVFSDSDTLWTPGLLANLQMPFVDPHVGGVSTQQNVYQRETSTWRRIADWMVNLRYYDYVPAMARVGGVICISGRTAAYRRSAIDPVMHNLENEFFMGRRCISGDDGRLTWLVLASGYKTTHQASAKALSMFPDTFRAFVKQRVRWSRNSYRTYLTALWKGWLWRVPFVSKVTVFQILLTPVTMGLTLGYLLFSRLTYDVHGFLMAGAWLLLGRGIRGWSHLRRHPKDVFLLPLMALVVIFVALPIKLYALFTMNKQGWLTRSADTMGGEGQTASTLSGQSARVARPVEPAAHVLLSAAFSSAEMLDSAPAYALPVQIQLPADDHPDVGLGLWDELDDLDSSPV